MKWHCDKSMDGRHNFPFGGADCLYCGINQFEISGTNFKRKDETQLEIPEAPLKGLHSELHLLVSDLRKEYNETATKGPGSFGFYLGCIKRLGVQTAYRFHSEIKDSGAKTPGKLFWWKFNRLL